MVKAKQDDLLYPRGSEWRKWDLQIHTKGTGKSNQFKSKTFERFYIVLFKSALEKKIAVIGITDYFSIENYKKVRNFVKNIDSRSDFDDKEKKQIKSILLLPNVELRMMPVTDKGRLVNIHCIFNPDYEDSLENNFFGSIEYSAGSGKKYKMNRQGLIDLGKSQDDALDNEAAYKKGVDTFVVTHSDLQKLLDENDNFRKNVIIAVSNSSRDGASAFQKHYDLFENVTPGSLDAVRKSIYSISDCIFSGNEKDFKYFAGLGKDDEEKVKKKCGSIKACIHGSDAHTEDDLFSPDQDKLCWIKADPTFEGLKQILYEPKPGERVWIGPVKPDQKDKFKVIKNIKFENTEDFPKEIQFNRNLCSIIGSRSSGKSALLAYVAHSIDPDQTIKKNPKGPGDGFPWDKVNFNYQVEWENGKTSNDLQGQIVYIPQNYLFNISIQPEEIKNRIKPVLISKLPKIGALYNQTERDVKNTNQQIAELVESWLDSRSSINHLSERLKKLGDKKAVETEKHKLESDVNKIKKKYKLNKNDLQKFQAIKAEISSHKARIEQIEAELLKIGDFSEKQGYFSNLNLSLVPPLENLPKNLQIKIGKELEKSWNKLIEQANKQILEYRESIEKEREDLKTKISNTKKKNEELILKYQKNIELEKLIENLNNYKETIKKINEIEEEMKKEQESLEKYGKDIQAEISKRKTQLKHLKTSVSKADQSALEGIKFGVEIGFDDGDVEKVARGVNIKYSTSFAKNYELDFEYARKNLAQLLEDIYSKEQKINAGFDQKEVAKNIFTLTEKILLTAEMEGDKIGGFTESTMTPGKRALFALRLLLAESEDEWPLLIDQPEDDLDSRAVYKDIVPFLKEKKKKRQIIMVSHNANLVIGSDSEQIIVANQHGSDRKNKNGRQFNYLTGSIEHTKEKDKKEQDVLLSQGIREHACDVLDGGREAFEHRRNKYNLTKV